MITQIDITGIHYETKADIKKYIRKKIGRLDRFVPRQARKSIKAEVVLQELKTKSDRNQCEVILHLPEQMITAKDSTINMFAAVDIVEKKLKNQLNKYKATHGGDHQDKHGRLRKLLRRKPRQDVI